MFTIIRSQRLMMSGSAVAVEPKWTSVAESWFDSYEARVAAISSDEGRRAAKRLAEDEARFIDYSRSRIFFVEEHVVIADGLPVV